jgi:hypothetical protein
MIPGGDPLLPGSVAQEEDTRAAAAPSNADSVCL